MKSRRSSSAIGPYYHPIIRKYWTESLAQPSLHAHPYLPRLAVADSVIAGSHELDEVNMPSTALRNSEEYGVAGGRKPPTAETNHHRPQPSGAVGPLPSPSLGTAAEVAKSISNTITFPPPQLAQERLLNAREVAARLGVSERWVRDHTTRRSPKIRAVKLGTLIRYRRADVEIFMENLDTFHTSRQPRFGV
jgi:excisionase family DNA binding protein